MKEYLCHCGRRGVGTVCPEHHDHLFRGQILSHFGIKCTSSHPEGPPPQKISEQYFNKIKESEFRKHEALGGQNGK